MSRGTYRPIDREKHPIMGWTEDRAVHYAKERAYDAAARPLLPYVPTIGRAIRAHHAAQNLRDGILLSSSGRSEAEKPLSQIGGELFHGFIDRQRATARISEDFHALADDIGAWFKTNQASANASSIAQWIVTDVTPAIEGWNKFVASEDTSWWTKGSTNWTTFEGWQNRLRQLRSVARTHGISLESGEPDELPKTASHVGVEGKGAKVAALLGVLKIAAAAALGIGGFVALYAVVRELGAPTPTVHTEHGTGSDIVQIPVQVQATP